MSKINILDSKIYNRIAAGEVVERPRSIVKELVENSLDAGATEITVSIEEGGIARISVTDNGCGVGADDLKKAFLPHATSKISAASDLDCLETLGFRGEALASIAAVSRVTMTSRTRGDDLGRFLTVDGGEFPAGFGIDAGINSDKGADGRGTSVGLRVGAGEEISVDGAGAKGGNTLSSGAYISPKNNKARGGSAECGECGAPFGTTVLVENLFENVPARKKFLGTPRAEEGEITGLMARLILAANDVSIKYVAGGRTVFHSGGKGLRDAIFAVYGIETLNNLCEISAEHPDIKVYGFVSRPGFARHSRAFQTFVVNGRYVTDSDVSNAVYVCFKDYLMVRQYPMYVLFAELPADMADVNIHPAKLQVRFANQKRVLSVLKNAINTALYGESLSARTLFAASTQIEPAAAKISTAAAEAIILSQAGKSDLPNKDSQSSGLQNNGSFAVEPNNLQVGKLDGAPSGQPPIREPFARTPSIREPITHDASLRESVIREPFSYAPEIREPENNNPLRYGEGLNLTAPPFIKGAAGNTGNAENMGKAGDGGIMAERPFSQILAESLLSEYNEASLVHNSHNTITDKSAVHSQLNRCDTADTGNNIGDNKNQKTEYNENLTAIQSANQSLSSSANDTAAFPPQALCEGGRIKRLGRLFNTYILLEIGNDFYVIDQHAAHERLIFDRLYAQAESGTALSQPLLLPFDFTVDEEDSRLLDDNESELVHCGVAIEKRHFGQYALCAVPLISAGLSESKFVSALLEMLKENRLSAARFVREKIISAACKAAVKGEDDLSESEVDAILAAMSKSDAVSCPHGRPAVLKIPRSEVEKWFRRRM